MTLPLPLTQGCAALALGYFRWLPTGADRWATHVTVDVDIHLESLASSSGVVSELATIRSERVNYYND
jgi:hypothetical protein